MASIASDRLKARSLLPAPRSTNTKESTPANAGCRAKTAFANSPCKGANFIRPMRSRARMNRTVPLHRAQSPS